MIKTKKCKLCDNPAFSKGLCKVHTLKKPLKFKRASSETKKTEKQEKRSIYFEYHIERCTHSEESGIAINEPNRSNICHLIDKGRHPSLQDNLDNCIYLTFSEHERYDKLLFSLEFEKLEVEFKNSWSKSCEKYKNLLSLCEENTKFTRELKKYLEYGR